MAYYPYGYQPMYQPQYQQMQGQPTQLTQPMPQTVPQMPQASIIWVDGYNEAAMYPVAPNAAVQLWDKSAPVVYLKKADATGRPMMQTFDLVERKDAPKATATEQDALYATKTDLKAVSDAVEVLREGLREMRIKIENRAFGEGVAKDAE
jgi:hypothetical protein